MARQSVTGSLASLRAVWNSSDQAAGVAAFHRTVATAGGNRFVTSIVNSIYGDFVRNDPAYLVRRSKAAGVGSYQALAEAIADADRAHAAALMGRLLTHDPVRA
jgi:DNA-binding FadR family transcriptional regulator